MTSLRTSPCTLGAPHNGLAMLISRISPRISNDTVGRPQRRRDFQRQYSLKPARCQRITVSGRTIASVSYILGNSRQTPPNISLSIDPNRSLLGLARRSTLICCRNTKISASSVARRSRSIIVPKISLHKFNIELQHRPILNQPPADWIYDRDSRKLDLFSAASVAIDGSKFKAVNARDKNFTEAKMKRRLERIDESIARYLSQLETADRHGDAVPEAKVERLKGKIEKLKEEIVRLNEINAEMMKSEDKQISLSDPDARSMATSGKDTGIVGYNVQIAVDTPHHLIVAHEVTNVGSDRHQLASMAAQTRSEMGVDTLKVVTDRGYYDSQEILACEEAGIAVTLPKPLTSGAKAAGRFGKQDFIYVAAEDIYRCPAGERLTYRFTVEEHGRMLRRYWTTACQDCALKAQCTTGPERRITRWEHEDVLEKVQQRLDQDPNKMTLRRQTAEHPFGTIKAWMGATHFLMRRRYKVATEMALNVLAYNMKRVIAILGCGPLLQAIQT